MLLFARISHFFFRKCNGKNENYSLALSLYTCLSGFSIANSMHIMASISKYVCVCGRRAFGDRIMYFIW